MESRLSTAQLWERLKRFAGSDTNMAAPNGGNDGGNEDGADTPA